MKEKKEKDMEVWNDVKDKKGSGLVIALLLLIIAGLGVFIFLNKDKLFETKEATKPEEVEKEETKEEEKEEEPITFTNSELQAFIDLIQPSSIGPEKSIYDVDKVVASKLSAREKIEYVGSRVYQKAKSSSDYKYSIIAESDVKEIVEDVYGPNTYERAIFNLGCGNYEFHEDDNSYYSQTGCGGTTAVQDENIIIDYKATKSKLEITTAYAFDDGATQKFYKDYNLTVDLGNSNGIDLKDFINDNKDELNHIVYTFESNDGTNYYFTGFTNNK